MTSLMASSPIAPQECQLRSRYTRTIRLSFFTVSDATPQHCLNLFHTRVRPQCLTSPPDFTAINSKFFAATKRAFPWPRQWHIVFSNYKTQAGFHNTFLSTTSTTMPGTTSLGLSTFGSHLSNQVLMQPRLLNASKIQCTRRNSPTSVTATCPPRTTDSASLCWS